MSTKINKPKQAVILSGGRGTRLRPLTNTMPKAMIPFNDKPFLEYLIEQVKEQGFEEVLLLLGYLSEKIIDHFGDGSDFGINIDYSVTDVENETGRRMKLAEQKLGPCFLLMYCDNYWPMQINKMWDHFLKTKASAQITVYTNDDNYTKNNVRVDDNGIVVCYDKTRTAKNLKGVEIGYSIIQKEVLKHLTDENVNFEKAIYPEIVNAGRMSAFVTGHRYYSVGSHERLHLTRSFFNRRPAIILDRDGVLNEKAPKAEYVKNWSEFKWLPGAKEAVSLLKSAGYLVILITNQAGIARGAMTESDLEDIHKQMQEELAQENACVDMIYHCSHGWDEGCECRKPKPGMLLQAQKDCHLDLSRTYFIGDDIRDQQAGEAAGSPTLMVSSDTPLLKLVTEKVVNH